MSLLCFQVEPLPERQRLLISPEKIRITNSSPLQVAETALRRSGFRSFAMAASSKALALPGDGRFHFRFGNERKVRSEQDALRCHQLHKRAKRRQIRRRRRVVVQALKRRHDPVGCRQTKRRSRDAILAMRFARKGRVPLACEKMTRMSGHRGKGPEKSTLATLGQASPGGVVRHRVSGFSTASGDQRGPS